MQNIHFLNMSLFEMFYYFCFWSCFGWALEVVDRTLETGGFENRGFLNGPFCPIYGFGVLMILTILEPFKDNILILFIASTIICSSLELFVGLLLQWLFHAKWWDYSDKKHNYKGYICLEISILWGLGCVLMVNVAQPLIERVVAYIPYMFGNIMIVVIFLIIISDLIASICEVQNLNNRLKQIDQLSNLLHDKSIALGENISDEVLELKAKYDKLLARTAEQKRLINAFPSMKSIKYNEALKKLRDRLNSKEQNPEKNEETKNKK